MAVAGLWLTEGSILTWQMSYIERTKAKGLTSREFRIYARVATQSWTGGLWWPPFFWAECRALIRERAPPLGRAPLTPRRGGVPATLRRSACCSGSNQSNLRWSAIARSATQTLIYVSSGGGYSLMEINAVTDNGANVIVRAAYATQAALR